MPEINFDRSMNIRGMRTEIERPDRFEFDPTTAIPERAKFLIRRAFNAELNEVEELYRSIDDFEFLYHLSFLSPDLLATCVNRDVMGTLLSFNARWERRLAKLNRNSNFIEVSTALDVLIAIARIRKALIPVPFEFDANNLNTLIEAVHRYSGSWDDWNPISVLADALVVCPERRNDLQLSRSHYERAIESLNDYARVIAAQLNVSPAESLCDIYLKIGPSLRILYPEYFGRSQINSDVIELLREQMNEIWSNIDTEILMEGLRIELIEGFKVAYTLQVLTAEDIKVTENGLQIIAGSNFSDTTKSSPLPDYRRY